MPLYASLLLEGEEEKEILQVFPKCPVKGWLCHPHQCMVKDDHVMKDGDGPRLYSTIVGDAVMSHYLVNSSYTSALEAVFVVTLKGATVYKGRNHTLATRAFNGIILGRNLP